MTTPPRLADRITALAGCVDPSGFAPFFAPVMFSLNENLWPTITLIASLVAILLIAFVMVGGRQEA
jgi:small neutral amino acid transporter SnatA (MarC family)